MRLFIRNSLLIPGSRNVLKYIGIKNSYLVARAPDDLFPRCSEIGSRVNSM